MTFPGVGKRPLGKGAKFALGSVMVAAGLALILLWRVALDNMNERKEADDRLVCAAAMRVDAMGPRIYLGSYPDGGRSVYRFGSPDGKYADGCYVDITTVMWRTDFTPLMSEPGRWRDLPVDEHITWNLNDDSVTINIRFHDGSGDSKTFTRAETLAVAKLPAK